MAFTTFVPGYNNRDVGNVTTLVIPGLSAGTTYYYRVRASNGCGASGNSATITYATLGGLPAPVATAATAIGCTGFTAHWGAVAGTTNYYLDVSTDIAFGSFVGGYNNFDAATATSAVIAGLNPGVTYYYRVRAGDACGSGASSNVITAVTSDVPAVPVAAAGSNAACTAFIANWAASAGATNYYLDVSTDIGFGSFVGAYNDLDVGNATSLNVTGLSVGTTYYYRVRAGNTCGTSGSSGTITYATLDVPAAPVATAGSGATCNAITANWNAVAGATGYRLDVSTDPAFGSFVGANNNRNVGNVTTFNVTGLTTGVTYYYRVRAENACGSSANSNDITYATLVISSAPVADPESNVTCSTADANWQADPNATAYILDVSTDINFGAGTFVFGFNGRNVANVTTYPVTGLAGNTTYYYRVRANNACGNSGNSNVITFTTSTAAPAQPGAITGATSPCVGSSQAYSVTNVAGVTYNWTFPAGWTQTGGGTTNSITVTVGAGTGNITVTPSNACGSGTAQTLAVTNTTIPAQPSTITGATSPCVGSSQAYSVTNVAGVTYNWTFPAGWTQTGGIPPIQ